MNANFNLPVLTSTYANFLAEMKSRDEDIAVWFEGTTSTNIPAGTKKWNSTGNKFEKWNGATWSDLSTLYEIKVRDSHKLNGQEASYYSASTHLHSAATTTANGFMSYTDKVKLNAIAANANNYSHPAGDGNLHVPANGTANNGKFLQATATAGIYAWASLPATSLSTLGVTATAAELNKLDGVTATATHLNYINTLSSNAQTQLNSKANLASPSLTGTPMAPTPATGDNSTKIATTAFVLANSIQAIPLLTAGTKLEAQSNLGVYIGGSTLTKKKEVSVGTGGGITVSFGMYADFPGASVAQIYVNGVARGTLRTTSSYTTITYTENITVVAGDLVQLYAKGDDFDGSPEVLNFKIFVASPKTSFVIM
jgi:hypothetical protein